MCFFQKTKHKQRRKGNKEQKNKKTVGKHVVFSGVFSRLLGDKLVFVRCLCGGMFVVSKFACGAIRLHTDTHAKRLHMRKVSIFNN